MISSDDLLAGLPGAALVRTGLADLRAGRVTAEAWLVQIAQPRLLRAGLLDETTPITLEAELELYRLLCRAGGDAYSRYNALLRELVSFEQALDHRLGKLQPLLPTGMFSPDNSP